MGCSSSILGWGPKPETSSQQPGSPASQDAIAAADSMVALSPSNQRLQTPVLRDAPLQLGVEPEQLRVAKASVAAVLRHGNAATATTLTIKGQTSGRSQLERGYQQLQLGMPLKEWDDLHVRIWLLTLPPVLRPYTDMLCSPGGLLLEWSDELLSEAGVSNIFHRKQLLEYVRQLQADVAARVHEEKQLQLLLTTGGEAAGGGTTQGVPVGILPGSVNSPHGSEDEEKAGGGMSPVAVKVNGRQPPAARVVLDSDPDLGSLTPTRTASLRRRRPSFGGNSASGGGGGGSTRASGGGGGVVSRTSKDGADVLAEYDQGLVEQGLSTLHALVKQAGAMCPWPGDAAAELLAALLNMGERALVNRRNWDQLNRRAVDLMQLIAANKQLQADTHTYRNIMHRLMNTLKGIREYYMDFTNRNWLSRIMGIGQDQQMFTQLWNALGGLVADASLGLQAAAAGGQEAATRVLERLQKRQAHYDDEEERLRSRIDDLGGVEALLRDPGALAGVAASLGLGDQITLHKIQEAVGLLEADRCEGVHSLIPHPDLRVLWRKCFASLQDVSWALWWEAFPAELTRVPVERQTLEALSARLADHHRRRAFEQRVDVSSAGRISVVDLRRAVPADRDLREVVAQLTERLSLDGRLSSRGGSGIGRGGALHNSATASLPTAVAATATASAAPSTDAAASPAATGMEDETRHVATAPYTSLEPRCSLPPLHGDRFVGREDDVRQLSHILMAGSGASPQKQKQPYHRHRRSSDTGHMGNQGLSGVGSEGAFGGAAATSATAALLDSLPGGCPSLPRSHAVCIVAEAGMGKSAVAVAAARRLWECGSLPGGAYYVDLRGADCRAEIVARFAGALAVGKAEHGDAAGTSAVSLALQALAARGALLLVLDGVDCLGDLYDASYDSVAPPFMHEAADMVADGAGDGGFPGGNGEKTEDEAEATLSELLSVVPTARVLLTSTEPLELRSREVEYWWLGPLPEPAAVALVQDHARCLTWDEARHLVSACGLSPLALRLAASAVAAGAITLRDVVVRARNAAALAAFTPPPSNPPGGTISPCDSNAGPRASLPGSPSMARSADSGKMATGSSSGAAGLSHLMPVTPRLMRSPSPMAVQVGRHRSPQTPPGRRIGGVGGVSAGSASASGSGLPPPMYGFTRHYPDGSTAAAATAAAVKVDSSVSPLPSGGCGAGDDSGSYNRTYVTPSPGLAPSPSRGHRARSSQTCAPSMSFLLRASQSSGGGGGSVLPTLLHAGSNASSRAYGSGAAVAAALLTALSDEHRMVIVQLSILPGCWDEDTASALLGQPPYTVRALLDVLVGYSLVISHGSGGASGGSRRSTGGGGGGSLGGTMVGYGPGWFRLTPGVLESARTLLADMDVESKIALQCRMVGHVLAQFLRPDRLYRDGAVRAAVQLATELRQDVQAMLLVAAKCADPNRMLWGTIGASRLLALAASPLFSALVLDATAEMEAFWRTVAAAAAAVTVAPVPSASGPGRATTPSSAEARRIAALAARALGQTLHKQGRYEEAEAAWRGALLQEQHLPGSGEGGGEGGGRPLELAACHSGLGRALGAQQRYGEAEQQHEVALRLRRAVLGDHHVDVASSLSDLARLMRLTGRYSQAEQTYQEVLTVQRGLLGEDYPAIADSYLGSGEVAGLQSRHREAESDYRKAVSIRKRTLGPDHLQVAQALDCVGAALTSQGKHEVAEQVLMNALTIKKKVLGPRHYEVGATLNRVALALLCQDKLSEAEAICRQAIAAMERSLSATHPAVKSSIVLLIRLLKRQGKDEEVHALSLAYRTSGYTGDDDNSNNVHVLQADVEISPGSGETLAAAVAVVVEAAPTGTESLSAAVGTGTAMAGASLPPQLGKPALAPLVSPKPRDSERRLCQQPRPEPQTEQRLAAPSQSQGQREGDVPLTLQDGSKGCKGLTEFPSRVAGDNLVSEQGPLELNARLDASSVQGRMIVEAAQAAQREWQAWSPSGSSVEAVSRRD